MNNLIEYENLSKLNNPFFQEYKLKLEQFLEKGWFVLGDEVKTFENQFAKYCGSKHCVGVANGLDGLVLALRSLNLPEESQVIVPSNTYIASILAILQAGLKPILVEPDIATYNIDPILIEGKITPKTKAIMVVHLYGKVCDMAPILEIAKRYNLHIIEDCAQSHGATYKGQKSGTFGDISAFSFYPTKNLGALGDAGSVNTNIDDLATKVRSLRNYGSSKKYFNDYIGYNSRLDEIQALFLNIKLKSLDEINLHKRKLASIYLENLNDAYIKPVVNKDYYDVYHIFNIRYSHRDKLKEYLNENDIRTEIHYPVAPINQKATKGLFLNEKTPIAEEIHATTLSLPISFFHTEEDVYKVVEIMNKFVTTIN